MNAAEMYEGKRGMNMTVGQGVPSEPRRVEESRVEGSKGRRVEGSGIEGRSLSSLLTIAMRKELLPLLTLLF